MGVGLNRGQQTHASFMPLLLQWRALSCSRKQRFLFGHTMQRLSELQKRIQHARAVTISSISDQAPMKRPQSNVEIPQRHRDCQHWQPMVAVWFTAARPLLARGLHFPRYRMWAATILRLRSQRMGRCFCSAPRPLSGKATIRRLQRAGRR